MGDGIFETLLYLIPIAILIVARMVNANKSAAEKKARAEQQKKAVKKKTVKQPAVKSAYRPLFPDEVSQAAEDVPVHRAAAADVSGVTGPALEVTELVQTGIVKPGLTPLQQAIVWTEILGQPKGA